MQRRAGTNLGKALEVGERHDEADGAALGVLEDAAQVRGDSDRRRPQPVKGREASRRCLF